MGSSFITMSSMHPNSILIFHWDPQSRITHFHTTIRVNHEFGISPKLEGPNPIFPYPMIMCHMEFIRPLISIFFNMKIL